MHSRGGRVSALGDDDVEEGENTGAVGEFGVGAEGREDEGAVEVVVEALAQGLGDEQAGGAGGRGVAGGGGGWDAMRELGDRLRIR